MPFQLGYRPRNIRKKQKAPTIVGASEIESELGNLASNQTNPEGRARLTRRLIMDLVCIVILEIEYSTRWFHNPRQIGLTFKASHFVVTPEETRVRRRTTWATKAAATDSKRSPRSRAFPDLYTIVIAGRKESYAHNPYSRHVAVDLRRRHPRTEHRFAHGSICISWRQGQPVRRRNSSYFGSKYRSCTVRARCFGASSLPSTNAS